MLATWNYEIFSNWAYSPATNATFVTEQRFPAVFGMVDLVRTAEREGYAVFYLTGRPAAQEEATLGNLTADGVGVDAGYPKAH
ncbi:HAD family acid phosphatase [Actinopolymorpha sp. NPDC004070]|uniref:HAD family acid phosphatase n=1 Tax=Actinopolymorpha sp. NPDC004070 TaxID=3154548 RepID=UPI0033AA3232